MLKWRPTLFIVVSPSTRLDGRVFPILNVIFSFHDTWGVVIMHYYVGLHRKTEFLSWRQMRCMLHFTNSILLSVCGARWCVIKHTSQTNSQQAVDTDDHLKQQQQKKNSLNCNYDMATKWTKTQIYFYQFLPLEFRWFWVPGGRWWLQSRYAMLIDGRECFSVVNANIGTNMQRWNGILKNANWVRQWTE